MNGFSYMPEIMTYKPAHKLNHRVPWPRVTHELCAATPANTSSLCNADRRVTVTFSPAAVGEEACEIKSDLILKKLPDHLCKQKS